MLSRQETESRFCDRRLPRTVDNTSSPQCPPVTSLTFASSDRQARSPRHDVYFNALGGGDHRFHHAIMDAHRCQAVTPSDMATALVALDATAATASRIRQRTVPLDKLYSGPGEPDLARDEMIVGVTIPGASATRPSAFCKLALWEGDFAMVSAALSAEVVPSNRWFDVRVVLGAAAPTPHRMRATERAPEGRDVDAGLVRDAVLGELQRVAHPLANNGWKIHAAGGVAAKAADLLESRIAR